jgi:hypothetical protein
MNNVSLQQRRPYHSTGGCTRQVPPCYRDLEDYSTSCIPRFNGISSGGETESLFRSRLPRAGSFTGSLKHWTVFKRHVFPPTLLHPKFYTIDVMTVCNLTMSEQSRNSFTFFLHQESTPFPKYTYDPATDYRRVQGPRTASQP